MTALAQDVVDAVRTATPAQAASAPTAWRVWWVSLNTARTEIFEDLTKATTKARETGGCVIPLYTAPPQPAIGPGNPVFEETRAAVTAAREKLLAEYKAENERLRAAAPPQTAQVAWDANWNRSYEPVETLAAEIYSTFQYLDPGRKPPWMTGGNSQKQDEARYLARERLREAGHAPALTRPDAPQAALVQQIEKVIYENASISHFGDDSEVDNAAYLAREIAAMLSRPEHDGK